MRAKEFITEKLKPSQYRSLVKGWNKARYATLFNNQYRLYIPLAKQSVPTKAPNPIVAQAVQSAGYQIDKPDEEVKRLSKELQDKQ